MEVGEGVSVVKGPIRGICATILKLVTLRIRRDISCAHCLGEKTFIVAQTLIINTGGWKYLVILLHLQKFEKRYLCTCDLFDTFIVFVIIINFEKVCQVLAVVCHHLAREVGVDNQGERIVVDQGVRVVANCRCREDSNGGDY